MRLLTCSKMYVVGPFNFQPCAGFACSTPVAGAPNHPLSDTAGLSAVSSSFHCLSFWSCLLLQASGCLLFHSFSLPGPTRAGLNLSRMARRPDLQRRGGLGEKEGRDSVTAET